MVWRFLKHYGKAKAGEVLDEFVSAVASFDPETASKAQIEMMEAELQTLGRRLAEAETEARREHQETTGLRRTYDYYLEAARLLEVKHSDGEALDQRAEIEASLTRLVGRLEQLKPEIEREEDEDREVEAWRAELRRSVDRLGDKLRAARSDLQLARRRVDSGQGRKEHAEEQDKRARAAAGMTSSISAMSVALDGMNQQTARLRAEADTLQLKAGLLHTEQLDSDPHVAAALGAARGTEGAGARSLSERLMALRSKTDAAQLTAAE